MRKTLAVQALFLLMTANAYTYSQTQKLADWSGLLDANKTEAARQLCTSYIDSSEVGQRVEAQKCLANVALSGHDIVQLQGDDTGGGTLGEGYTPEAVDEALAHLNIALKLAPRIYQFIKAGCISWKYQGAIPR